MLRPKKKKKKGLDFLNLKSVRFYPTKLVKPWELAGLKNREIRSAALEQGSETVRLTVNPWELAGLMC